MKRIEGENLDKIDKRQRASSGGLGQSSPKKLIWVAEEEEH